MDAVRVSALRESLAGTGWLESTRAFAGTLRHAVTRRTASDLLLVGTRSYEPWHLAAHLDDEAAWAGLPALAPVLVRHDVRPDSPAHLSHGLPRLAGARRGATVLVVARQEADEPLLDGVQDARRRGATVLALDTGERELAALAHERLSVPEAGEEPFDLVQHLVSAAAGETPGGRSRLGRLLHRLAGAPVQRW
ncbi:hypothetical protein [Kitasatospora camelliae]|uniref:SIS domain-containing protein n=1 Tax=Kitasatospora camelliae TaxID=3156397 RepID=A0AAU8JSU8_9ACTN